MPGEFSLDQVVDSGAIGNSLYDQLFGAQDFTGIGEGFGAGNSNWFDQVQLSGDQGWGQGAQTGGFQGNWFDPVNMNPMNESGNTPSFQGTPNQKALDSYKNYTFNYTPGDDGAATLQAYNPEGSLSGTYNQRGQTGMNQFMSMAAPAFATAMFGGALAPMLGGGAMGLAGGNALASGAMTGMRGGDLSQVGTSMLSSGLGAGVGAFNPAAQLGLSGTAGQMVNSGTGSALGSALRGGSGKDILTSGLQGSLVSGLNSVGSNMANSFGDLWNSFGGGDGGDMEFDQLQGSGGDMSGQTDVSSNTYDTSSPDFRFGGEFSQISQPNMPAGQQAPTGGSFSAPSFLSSFSAPSGAGLSSLGSSLGNFAGNNAGDLASLLYGMYNNKRQRNALQQGQNQQVDQANNNLKMFQDQAQKSIADISGRGDIENIYGQNSPYAQQLRAQLQAKAAASGRRLNTSGREVQLQAALADRAAQMQTAQNSQLAGMYTNFANTQANLQNQQQGAMGQQYQNQLAQNNLKNNNMNMILQGANKMGLFNAAGQGLQSMFGSNPVMQNSQPFQNYFGDYNSLGGGQ